MSTNCTDFDGFLSPTSKRFRSDMETPSNCPTSGEQITSFVCSPTMPDDDSRIGKDCQVDQVQDYVVCEDEDDTSATKRRRLLGSPQYATAAVSHLIDSESRHSNGDSGFQELNSPDEITLEMNGNEPIPEEEERDQDSSELPADDNMNNMIQDDDNLSDLSAVSDISDLSDESWKPISNNLIWVREQMQNGANPKSILLHLTGEAMPEDMDDVTAWQLLVRLLSEPDKRQKLDNVNTIDDVVSLIQNSRRIIVLTGAGVSVSCGIPDFRSRNGIYARLSQDYPDLPDPQAMFDIGYFRRNPYPFFKFAKEIYPGQFAPSPSHNFIKAIEDNGKLLRNYTQNIDTLEKTAGIKNVITCHGSFATATCAVCSHKCPCEAIQEDIFAQKIPLCPVCSQSSDDNSIMPVMKPDIVFFGEGLGREFHDSMNLDKDECDLLIVMGSSLKVRPVALIPSAIPANVPQILINREPLNHLNFDVELLGDCDEIIKYLCSRLGDQWSNTCFGNSDPKSCSEPLETSANTFDHISPSRYVFKGAELNSIDSDDSDVDSDESGDDDIDDDSDINQETSNSNAENTDHASNSLPTDIEPAQGENQPDEDVKKTDTVVLSAEDQTELKTDAQEAPPSLNCLD